MRYALVLTAAALLAPFAAGADDPAPPITFQTQPVEQLLNNLRTAADLVGGEKAVKAFDDGLKEKLGDKGFGGLDLTRPALGYVALAPKLEDVTAVLALPVSGEKEFLALCERWNGGQKPKDLGQGLYEVPPLFPELQARMKLSDRYAYIATGKNPEPALGAKAIVPPHKLLDPAEPGLVAVKLHFDRVTPELKKALVALVADAKKKLLAETENDPDTAAFKPAFEELEKLAVRYMLLLGGAESATLRLNLDAQSGEMVAEAVLAPKPNTELAKQIAARKPNQNRFAALLTPDTVAGFKFTMPVFAEELTKAYGILNEAAQKQAAAGLPPGMKGVFDEYSKGQLRTMKAGEGDFALALRGPDKDGYYTAVGATAFEDPSALEKEFKKFADDDNSPLREVGAFKWDADKEGKVAIHTFKFGVGIIPGDFSLFGDGVTVAFAFAPKGIYLAVGPDPVKAVKEALNAKPQESPALDVVVNPAKLAKLVEKAGGERVMIEKVLGKEDKLTSAASLTVTGGEQLKVRFALSMKVLPRALFSTVAVGAAERVEPGAFPPPPPPPVIK